MVSQSIWLRVSALGQAVSELAQASKLSGFHTATSSEEFPRLRAPIERQYEDVDQVAGRAQDKRARHMLSAKQAFARAIGLPQMIAAEADPKEQERMKQEAAAEFGEFTQKYGDAKGAENRKELRKSLRKVERELAKVSRKQAL